MSLFFLDSNRGKSSVNVVRFESVTILITALDKSTYGLLSLDLAIRVIHFLNFVSLRVIVHVKSLVVRSKKKRFEIGLKLLLSYERKLSYLLLLPIEHVLVTSELSEVSIMHFLRILVLLFSFSGDGLN
jgi:hypothetical protein